MKSWPAGLPTRLRYRGGERPLHDYLAANAAAQGGQPAYVFYGREIGWAELYDAARRLAGFLGERGVARGDRVGLFLQNCPQYVIAHYAVQLLGAVVCPMNPQYKAAEVSHLLNEAEACAVVAGRELYPVVERARAEIPSLHTVIVTRYAEYLPERPTLPLPAELQEDGNGPVDAVPLPEALAADPLEAAPPVNLWQDVSLMTFTSGTTGRPKGAMLTGGNALFKTAAFFHACRMQPGETSLAIAPLCHIAGMVNGVDMPVYSGGTCVLLARFDPETTIQALEKYRCATWYSIAPMNAAILAHAGVEQRDLRSLRRNPATSFGLAVTRELAGRWEKLTGCRMHEASYGLSETHTCDTFMPRDGIRYGSVGIPTYDTDLRILDPETGEPRPAGEQGEIVLRNPGVFRGYWRRPEATAETLRDGWVHTGDIGHLDPDGYLYFDGRIKEMIKCSGYSVFPEDVEALLARHPAVAQAAVVPVPDERRGQAVKAFIVPEPAARETVTPEEIIGWSRENMAAYKVPREVEFRHSLPATPAGKVLRRLLRE
ncbi:MAG TPA: AMP-binding protein [Gammaproteobacteria bacterium]|nr:AMP-binding protein [Gammaproteobacteria bacterium]